MSLKQEFCNVNSVSFRILAKWGTAVLCFMQMWYVSLEYYRHWTVIGPSSRVMVIFYLALYPLIWLHLTKKNANPLLGAILVYCALGTAALLIFPTAP